MNSNMMEVRFRAIPENEAFARMVISAFLVNINPPVSVLSEVRTAVSEAVTNVIVHAGSETAILRAEYTGDTLSIEVEDNGLGIEDIHQAMQPFYTSKPDEERTGIGFALMQSFMDRMDVVSTPNCGTVVKMAKRMEI